MSATGHAMDERCEREIRELHRFFVDWFVGRIPDDDPSFARLERALMERFRIVTPEGQVIDKVSLLGRLRSAHGVRADRSLTIDIRNVRVRHLEPPLCLLTYEEWQHLDGVPNGRLSTVLFREDATAPHGVAWLHVHEVGLSAPD